MKDFMDALMDDGGDQRSEEDYPQCPFLLQHSPLLHDFARFDRYKGKKRTPGKIGISTDGPLWVVSISDPDNSRWFNATGNDTVSALATLEHLVESGQIAWRYWGKRNTRKERGK